MISTLLIIAVNLGITLWGFEALQRGDRRALFIPYETAQGRNWEGVFLSMFTHANWAHFVFNMLSFYFFAPLTAQAMGDIAAVILYLVAGVGGSILVYIVRHKDPRYSCLGASGAVSGIIFASILFQPQMNIYFMFVPLPIPGPIYALLYLALTYYMMKRGGDGISHEAHFGGAITGIVAAIVTDPGSPARLLQRMLNLF
ncbi:MAG: rhomboid family intramembrane serine protease [Leptospirales bacterium]|nr:rhomboid family intramembrane serine protease [Leptospirales bacterium]